MNLVKLVTIILIIRMGRIKTMQSFVMKRFTILYTMILDSNVTAFARLAQLKEITQTLYITMVLVTAHS